MDKIGYVEIALRIQDGDSEDAARRTFEAYTVLPPLLRDGASIDHLAGVLDEIIAPLVKAVMLAAAKSWAESGVSG